MNIYKISIDEAIETMERVITKFNKYPSIYQEDIWHLTEAIRSLEMIKDDCEPHP